MESSQFSDIQQSFEAIEQLDTQGATCDTFRVRLYGKLHFLKRLKPEHVGDIRYQEAFRKEFETGYRLEHPNLVRYVSLTANGILMEYIDGVTLTERLAQQPEYFLDKHNTRRFVSQLLDVVGYLHSHQVLHLDLKPDNILLTRIGSDVKLIDLGFCYTDTFTDTQGHTDGYAAPEQLSHHPSHPSPQADIYAIGKILQQLPGHHIYNKVIARCTHPDEEKRYQRVEEIEKALSNSRQKSYLIALAIALLLAIIVVCITLNGRHREAVPIIEEKVEHTETTELSIAPQEPVTPEPVVIPAPTETTKLSIAPQEPVTPEPVANPVPNPQQAQDPSASAADDTSQRMEKELDRLMDAAYRSTIVTFCDSIFPSRTTGQEWKKKSTEFHEQTQQVVAEVSKKYPKIPESVVIQLAESRFQNLTAYVFNKMRENGQHKSDK